MEDEDGGAGGKRASISDALQDLVERLAARLHEEAEVRVTAARQATLQQITDLKERLSENEAHRKSLEDKHQHAREALKHYRQSVKEHREAEASRHAQQVQQIQAELRLAHQTIAIKQEETSRLNREGAQLVAELTHTRQALSAEEERGKRQLQELERLRAIAAHHDVLLAQAADKDALLLDLRQQLATATEKQENLDNQVRGLEHALVQANGRAEAQEIVTARLQALLELGRQPHEAGQDKAVRRD